MFVRSGTNWIQQHYLKAPNTEAFDRFGISVTLSGSTVVIGADLEDSAATGVNGDASDNTAGETGAAYVFDLTRLNQTAPSLSITPNSATQFTLSWTPATPGFALQETLSLAPMTWSNAPSGETNPIILPASGQTKFFRLFKP